jgi:3-methyladenine DNA glycosylase AlkC
MADIPVQVLEGINRGELETLTLVELLAADQVQVIRNTLGQSQFEWLVSACVSTLELNPEFTFTQKMKAIGQTLVKELTKANKEMAFIDLFSKATSDIVRSYVAYLIGFQTEWTIAQKLELIFPLADDPNPGVREFAWMAVRDHLMKDTETAVELLTPWVSDASANIRRFATEVTRPKGVWCKQWELMKQQPELALGLLDPLAADQNKYVQNSVANWMNDASKSRPDFVAETTKRWLDQYQGNKATAYIVKRSLRTLEKLKVK